ncbi:MAG: hypothetical protein FWG53_04620 [Clostridiales bacterium]|nr:hypothetical protein [Clostridiales bacterium]
MSVSRFQIIEYDKVLVFAKDLKVAIDSFHKRIPMDGTDVILTWDDLKDYAGKSLDIISNRRIAMDGDGFVSTINNILGKRRERILRQVLKEYNSDIYHGL